jgi:hypothetical protein
VEELKYKKATLLILAMLASLCMPSVFAAGDTFSVEYHFESVPMSGCGDWMVKDTFTLEIPGAPVVPYYAASVLIPQDSVVKEVKVKTSAPIIQEGIFIPWANPPCTFSDKPEIVGPNQEIYGNDNVYPHSLHEVTGVNYFRGCPILNVNLFMVQYLPQSERVKFYETMTLEIKFEKTKKHDLYRGLPGDKNDVAKMVSNPEMAETYSDGPSPSQIEEYIIITDDTMQSTFQQLANWKAGFVNGTGVYTVSWITSNYTGVDNQEKIRNFIIDWYTNHGLKYVLLGGDVSAVPYRGFYIYSGGYVDYDMLADMYFSHLDGSWNDDGDSYWAEPGEEDWYAEIGVGRAPAENTTEAQNFVDKVIAYEQAAKPKRALLHQSRVMSGNSPDSRCLAWNCASWLPGDYTIDNLFEEEGTITKAVWIEHWGYDPAVVAHIGHGNTSIYYVNYEPTVSWYNSDVPSLTNTFWPWTTSVACICGQIEANDCLAEAYVMDPDNGAIVSIYNDNYGWFSTLDACKYSGEFCEMEFRACWNDDKEKFGDMLSQARSYMVSSAQSNSTYRWCFYERNIVGDPESPSLTVRGGEPYVNITSPQNGETVSGTVLIETETYDIDTVEFYIDGVLKYTDTTEPFAYSWDTKPYPDGNHTILVNGYRSGALEDQDEITVNVYNPEAYVTITNPHEGDTVKGRVTITTETLNIDKVEFYIDGVLEKTDTRAPFEWTWNTRKYSDGPHTIMVKGYASGAFMDDDQITVTVKNSKNSIALLAWLLLFLPVGIYFRRR